MRAGNEKTGVHADSAERWYAGDIQEIPDVRHWTRSTLLAAGIPRTVVEDAELCAAELAANAVRHVGGEFRVTLSFARSRLRIAVADTGPLGGLPERVPHDLWGEDGRGLQIVAAIAARWGAEADGAGKVVWCAFTW